jgi:hypothetical protein
MEVQNIENMKFLNHQAIILKLQDDITKLKLICKALLDRQGSQTTLD